MPAFKPKANKKFLTKKSNNITLDGKHAEIMKSFQNNEDVLIPKLKQEKKELKSMIGNNISIQKRLEIQDKIDAITKEITKLKTKKKEYLLDNSKKVFNYFENRKNVSEGVVSKKTILHSFFNKNTVVKKKNDLNDVQQYLMQVDESLINMNDFMINYDMCKYCSGELISVEHEGVVICKKCSKQFSTLIENEKPSYKEPPKEVCFYAYKRINHFREILAQFQAKETTQIPDEVLDNIKNQIKKERITLAQMTNAKAKDILKKLGYNKYYEHIPFIKDKLGIKPPIMTHELEDTLCNLFMEIQKPYAKHCPDNRVNFLNYYYVLFKLCELLGEHQFLPFFPMLKDPWKKIEQDEIWKKICKELNWEFIPTM